MRSGRGRTGCWGGGGGGGGGGGEGAQHGEGGVAARVRFTDQYQQVQKISLQLSSACELEVVICCLWCILYFNTNLPLFLLVYCVAACM